jgi:hypothetical protein
MQREPNLRKKFQGSLESQEALEYHNDSSSSVQLYFSLILISGPGVDLITTHLDWFVDEDFAK